MNSPTDNEGGGKQRPPEASKTPGAPTQFFFGARRYASTGPRRLFVPQKPLMSPVFFRERALLLALLGTHRLPAIFGQREFVDAGGLMSYGANWAELSDSDVIKPTRLTHFGH